ncbi:Malonyl CoA-acyl carrier protein transacylase [Alloactinosynnema sp. L-07]|uniref:non-ribosomal peptide synthetase n=1 Tax=Alloactinosynnema sp. L-07 TaxID=1653480 RepID=UPI00065F0888|nr:non-ribosomal peptide synthetase [Alloactinosynnema sp. L-07]CRK56701.1 Malonyl CoA-acyl carrier protein transacylase [Alloactinosynnema sp. L-07]
MTVDLTVGQRKIAAAQRPAAAAFWGRALDGAVATAFPPDVASAPRTGRAEPLAELPVPADLAARLVAVSRGDDLALHTVLVAATMVLLADYTAAEDVLVGEPATAAERLASVLPARHRVAADDTFRSVLSGLRAAVREAFPHRDFPVDLTGVDIDVVVALDALHPPAAVAGVEADVVVHLGAVTAGGATLRVLAEPERFRPDTAVRIGEHLLRVLAAGLADPDAPVGDIDLRSDADRAILARINDTAVPFADTATLPDLFARTVAAKPHAPAVHTGDTTLTFAELDARVSALAGALRERGVGRDMVVGVLARRSVDQLVAVLAVLRAGGAYLPLDPALPAARLAGMVDDSKARLVLAAPEHAGLLPDSADVVGLDESAPAALASGRSDDAAYVIYTSGSTGAPKGVVVEHRSVVNRLAWMQRAYPLAADDVILHKTPASFDVSVWELFWWLIEGAQVCLLEAGGERDPEAIVAAVERHQVTTLHFVPTMLGAFLAYVAETGAADRLRSLRRVFASGEALGAHHVHRFAEVLGHADLVNLYGPTEATVDVSHHRPAAGEDVVPIGVPIDNTRLYVLDKRRGHRPVGVPGELYIAGDCLARGYHDRAELTAQRFVVDPFPGERRAYRTGDLVRLRPDGALEFLGRDDFQVKIRGFRVELGEIEHELAAHPAVDNAVVVARTRDDGQQALRGYVTTRAEIGEDDLRAHLARRLPEHMVPVRIVVLDAFPLTANGKLDRAALPEPAGLDAGHVAPRTDRERVLADIVAEVLGLDRVGVHDGFFAMGGNSIHFVSVLAKARKAGLDFTFQQLFAHPTVAELAERAETAAPAEETDSGEPFALISPQDRAKLGPEVEDAYPMTMLQAGLIFQTEMTRGSSQYHDIISYLIRSGFDAEVFTDAVRILVAHNPILRTSYRMAGFSEYLQVVHREVEPPLFVADLRHLDTDAQEQWYVDWVVREQAHAFDWEVPGLVRLHIHVLSDDLYRYSISQHNSALDGWSINQLHTRLFAIYHALLGGGEYRGEPVPNFVRTFSALESASVTSEADRDYWAERLAERPTTVIPRLRPLDADAAFQVVLRDIPLPRGLSDRIIAFAGARGVPVKNVLLAAHLKVLSVLAGQADVLTGYEHSGRPEQVDADKAMGLFLNTVPLRVALAPGTWAALVRQVYDTEIDLLPHRRYQMAKVKQDLRTTDSLFETVFNFTHFYSLKALRHLPEFALLDVRAVAITEFAFRSEFSQHFYTDEVRLSLHYHTDTFDADHIERVGGYFVAALEAITATPDAEHTATPLLGPAELARITEFEAAAGARVLDPAGLPTPIGTPGSVVRDGVKQGTGRWTTSGDLVGEATTSPAAETQERPAAEITDGARRVAAVWGDVLGLDPDALAADDDFFQIGGNSLAAMRVVMMLGGLVSLKDVMVNSRLGELGAVAGEAAAASSDGVLVRLSDTEAPRATLVCFPYGAGHAVHFRPVADAVARTSADVAVYAVELPGHDPKSTVDELRPVTEVAQAVLAELDRIRTGPIVLWGHCVGAAAAIEVARLLRERGTPAAHLFIGAKLLYAPEAIQESIDYVASMSYADIKHWLTVETGFTGFDELGDGYADLLTRTFRHDSGSANAYFLGLHAQPLDPPAPTTAVFAADDPVTEGFAQRYADWERAGVHPAVRQVDSGGHYFTRTRPAVVAGLVAEALGEAR